MTIKITKWIEENPGKRKFFPDEGVWKDRTGPIVSIPGNSRRMGQPHTSREWAVCDAPRKVLYSERGEADFNGGTVTHQYEVNAGMRVAFDALELETVVRSLMAIRRMSSPDLISGGNRTEYLRITVLLGKLGVKAEEMD